MSRSAFYKYRDAVFPFYTMVKEQIITLFFHLEDRSGTLSHLLQVVAESGCNVLSIHQTIPLQGRANVTLSVSTRGMDENIDLLMNVHQQIDIFIHASRTDRERDIRSSLKRDGLVDRQHIAARFSYHLQQMGQRS